MNGKKLVALMLACLMLLSVPAVLATDGKAKIPLRVVVKHDIATDQLSFADMKLFNELEEQAGVDIQWEEIPSSAMAEKVGLILAGGDLPDAFWGEGLSDADILNNAGTAFIPLNDLIEKFAPNLKAVLEKRPELKAVITASDGNIYSLPRVRELYFPAGRTTWGINQKWLNALKLEMPTTTEEFYDVLVAFKTLDPNGNGRNDEIPFIFQHKMGSGSVRSEADLYPAFGVFDNTSNNVLTYHLMMESGKVLFTPVQNGYKEALKFMNRLYSEGLMDKEVFTTDSATYYAKVRSEDDIVGALIDWTIDDSVGMEKSKANWSQPSALIGPNGDRGWGIVSGSQYARNYFCMTIANQYPEETMKWVDQMYAPENSVQLYYGPEGVMLERQGDKLVALEPPAGMTYGTWKWGNTCADNGPLAILSDYQTFFIPPEQQVARAKAEAYVAEYLQKEPYPNLFFSLEDTSELKKILVDINSYVESSLAQFITEGNIDNNWDAYVNQLDKMKLGEALEILQRAYDNAAVK